MKRLLKRIMLLFLTLLVLLLVGVFVFMRTDRFGTNAIGDRLLRMQNQSNYLNGAFDNLENTPALAEGTTYMDMLRGFFFSKKVRNRPSEALPVVQTDLKNLPLDSNLFVWFGHSSYLIQLDNKKILVDPVFSRYASPTRFSIKAFDLTYDYTVEDFPEIDILVITHDHWDHLDYNTIIRLRDKVKHVVTGLGVGAHLERWGYPAQRISELYWGEDIQLENFKFTSTTARHFAGRTFKRNVTLWSSFVLEANSKKIFIGGDSGYGKHFKDIGDQYGPFDYAFLENGQYNEMWKYIHMMPEEVIKASKDLKTKYTIPVHSSKFPLANHAWDEPLIRVTKAAKAENFPLITPKIGQVVSLDSYQELPEWWMGIE